ncbi:MAG: diacylglycerol kinase family lipid kinase, partial [Clostridia bacterium]|nr:diacylglycerol kinase family lipid kinase [Clostridia bacterium]
MRYCFIINPASGKSHTKEGLENTITEAFAEAEFFYTKGIGDATNIAEQLCHESGDEEIHIYACGGDGTISEVVNGIMQSAYTENVRLGVLPVGTGNDLVRSFGSKEQFLDLRAQRNASEVSIDLIRANDFYAVNMINIGFDCQVVVNMASFKKHVPSRLAYIFGLIYTLVRKPGVRMNASADGEEQKRELLLCTFANGSYCGGGFKSNPNASVTDGKLNALFVNNISRTKFIGLVGSYKKGTHLTEKNAKILSEGFAKQYKLSFDAPTDISVDGEIIRVSELELECVSGALRMLVPEGCAVPSAKSSQQRLYNENNSSVRHTGQ